jgi:SAM-dependent methyltransferase
MNEITESMRYFPDVFNVQSETHAKSIILTPEAGLTPDERWAQETEFLTPWLAYLPTGLLIDYGMGIGRLARLLVQRDYCVVLGVDISQDMRRLAETYVQSPHNFCACSPQLFGRLARNGGMRADGALAVWAFQHIPEIDSAICDLQFGLRRGAPLLVVNRWHRAIPAFDARDNRIGWVHDGVDVHSKLLQTFVLEKEQPMPATLCAPGAHVRLYRKTA